MNMYGKIKLDLRKEALNLFENVIQLEYISGLAKAMMYYLICTIQEDKCIEGHICNDRKLISYVNGYLALRKQYAENVQKLYDESTIFIKHAFDDDKVIAMLNIGKMLAAKYAR